MLLKGTYLDMSRLLKKIVQLIMTRLNSYWPISTNPDTSKKIEPPETYAGVFYGPTELIYEEK